MIWGIKTYIIAYVKTQKKIRFIIHYVKPTAQLLFKIRFSKGGPTCRRQVVNPRHQTTISCKAWDSPAEYPSWVVRCDIKGSVSTVLNPICSKKVQGQKHPGRWGIVEHQIYIYIFIYVCVSIYVTGPQRVNLNNFFHLLYRYHLLPHLYWIMLVA